MTFLTVQITGVDALKAKLTPVLYQGAVTELLTSLALIGERTARIEAPKDTSAGARSIVSEVQPMMAMVYTPLAYMRVMNDGRAPGARMPPPDALAGWAQRHGFTGSLFVLARSIGRRGIKGVHFMEKARDAVVAAMPAEIEKAARKVVEQWRG